MVRLCARQIGKVRRAIGVSALACALAAPSVYAQVQEEPRRSPQFGQLQERFDIERFRQLEVIRRGEEQQAAPQRESDPRLANIDWDAARADHERQLAAFRERTQATATRVVTTESYTPFVTRDLIDRLEPVHMPVLLPQVNGLIQTRSGGQPGLMLRTRPNFYDASYDQDGMSVSISGTRIIRHRMNSPQMREHMDQGRGADGVRVEHDESGGLTANFSRYGAAYTVTVECGTSRDPRCQSEDAIREIVGRLVVAGGNPEE
ncbi:MAG: hypothetical protein JJU18_01420 [Oceanicaulis sp.]|nr:hypothetical protein [Oceanicaulis sp.]